MLNIQEIAEFINKQSEGTRVYLGVDSERFKQHDSWFADYILVVVVHINGNNGCKIFGDVVRERDYDTKPSKPSYRLMNEAYKVSELYLQLYPLVDKELEVHLDINPDLSFGSSCVVTQAIGYIKGTCNVEPLVKPLAFAASYAADRYKSFM